MPHRYTLTKMHVKLSQMMSAVYAAAAALVLAVVIVRGELPAVVALASRSPVSFAKPMVYGVLS